MSSTLSFDAHEVPDVNYSGAPADRRKRRDPRTALQWAYLPVIITVSVNLVFLVAYWVPEFARFPGHGWLLDQLGPLASTALTSQGQPVAEVQAGRGSLIATFLLLSSLALPALFRARQWQVRWLVPAGIGYLGAVGTIVTLLGLLARGQLGGSLLAVLLMIAWVVAIGITVKRLVWVSADDLPRRPSRLLWLVVVLALLHPIPIALGRRVFAPELRTAAEGLLAGGQEALRYAALVTSANIAVYASGVAILLVLWAGFMVVPPWQPVLLPWARASGSQPRKPVGDGPRQLLWPRLAILGICLVALVLTGSLASAVGQSRAQQLSLGSPVEDLALTCGTWDQHPDGQPIQTLALSGPGCRTATAFGGYAQVGQRVLETTVSPVRAETPAGAAIRGRVVGAQYGPVVVVASTDSAGFSSAPDQLQGIRVSDAQVAWSYRCDDDGDLRVRFAGADAGDDPAAGRITEFAERPSVIGACSNTTVRLNPQTGKRLPR